MKEIKTRDGSITFHNEEFNEAYHSTTIGALEEAKVKYVEPAHITEGDVVLDFCFGLGYNSLAAISQSKSIQIIGLELDIEILDKISTNEVPKEFEESYLEIQKAVLDSKNNNDNKKIKIIIGDASKEIKKLPDNFFNAILFDPFSPGKHKELWSEDVFKDCFRVLKNGGLLTTYSCAKWIRNNMRSVGFEVIDGPIFGRKSPSTIAIKQEK